jgi:hypothetical protein
MRNSYALDGLSLRQAEILTPGDYQSLPLSDATKKILSKVDVPKTAQEQESLNKKR